MALMEEVEQRVRSPRHLRGRLMTTGVVGEKDGCGKRERERKRDAERETSRQEMAHLTNAEVRPA